MSDLLKRLGIEEQGSETSNDAATVAGEMRNAEETAQQLESDPNYPYKSENLSTNGQLAQTNSLAASPVDDVLAFQRARRERSERAQEGQPKATLDPALMNDVHNTGLRNWWNSFMNSIDE